MSETLFRISIWFVALLCALTGIATVAYGYLTIYSLSGFSSIFIGVAIIVISIGLIKKHSVARIGAILVFIVSSVGCLMWVFIFQPGANLQQTVFGLYEIFCFIYAVLAIIAILFLSLKRTKEYCSVFKK